MSASYFLSGILTSRFEEFRDDYTSQQAFAALREVLKLDLDMIRFARSVPMREEARRYLERGDLTAFDPLLDTTNADTYQYDFAMIYENGSNFRVGYSFAGAAREVIDENEPLVEALSSAVQNREIHQPTGFIVSLSEGLCFAYACPLRGPGLGRRVGLDSGLVVGRWLSHDAPVSENYPEFTVRFLQEEKFDWPENAEAFDFASILRESNGFRFPSERVDGRRGGRPGPGRGGRRREPPLPRFMDQFMIRQENTPSALLVDATFFRGKEPYLNRDNESRTVLCARLGGAVQDRSVVVEMLLPRALANAVDESIRLVQWTSVGVAVLIGLFTFAVVREINRRRFAEAELVVSNDELKDSNRKKDRLLSIVAHDLRAPLSGVVNLAGLMRKTPESFTPKEIREFATDIQETSKRLTELLENLLNWARLQIGKLPYVPVAIDVSMMLRQVVLLFDSTARQKRIDLVSEGSDGLRIVGDQEMLRTVLRNLVGNAIQYTPESGVVTISVEQTGGFVAIRVADTGPGLPPERLETLFELPSHPNWNEGDGSRGAGFGLVLCKELVDRLEGHLAVESKTHEGTVFTVCIPERLDLSSTERITRGSGQVSAER